MAFFTLIDIFKNNKINSHEMLHERYFEFTNRLTKHMRKFEYFMLLDVICNSKSNES